MKILFQSRTDIYKKRGGDTVQMEKTKEWFEKLFKDVEVDISTDMEVKNINNYDIVHLFNLDWIPETYPNLNWAKLHNKPVVLSAIHHSEDEVKRYEKEYRFDIRRIFNLIVPDQWLRDEFKNIYRSILSDHKKLRPTINQIIKGIRNQQKYIVENADIILVQTQKEIEDIRKDFKTREKRFEKVVNGVDLEIFRKSDSTAFKKYLQENKYEAEKILLTVGRIEPRKNQLSVINAFEELQSESEEFAMWKLVMIGEINKYHPEYILRIKNKIKKNKDILYLGRKDQPFLASAMRYDGVYIQASWFETTGLGSLEAASCGMVPVASGERTKEYLMDNAVYCDPGDIKSIKNAILKASKMERIKEAVIEELGKKYSWEETAKQTYKVYKDLLK